MVDLDLKFRVLAMTDTTFSTPIERSATSTLLIAFTNVFEFSPTPSQYRRHDITDHYWAPELWDDLTNPYCKAAQEDTHRLN